MSISLNKKRLAKNVHKSHGYTSDFLLTPVMRFFQILSCRQRAMKISIVATPELATRQNLKKSHHRREQKIVCVAAALPRDVNYDLENKDSRNF